MFRNVSVMVNCLKQMIYFLAPAQKASKGLSGETASRGTKLKRTLFTQCFRNQERQVDCLARVKARIAMCVVPVGEVSLGDVLGSAQAFGDISPGQLKMNAACMGAFGAMNLEEAPHFLEHA